MSRAATVAHQGAMTTEGEVTPGATTEGEEAIPVVVNAAMTGEVEATSVAVNAAMTAVQETDFRNWK